MAKNYQWRATTVFASDTSLSYGVSPSDKSNWQTAEIGSSSGTQTYTYFFRDSNVAYAGQYIDAYSSRVAINVTQSWTTSVDNRNNLSVSVNTVINSIVRDDLRGYNLNTPGRTIQVYNANDQLVATFTDTSLASAHTISGAIDLGTVSFTLEPGVDASNSSLHIHNSTIGYSSYDDVRAGIQFRNILPKDYRSGMIWDGSSWQSHNRDNGMDKIYTGSGWNEMRTNNGAESSDDPPYMRHNNKWLNQRLIGNNQ